MCAQGSSDVWREVVEVVIVMVDTFARWVERDLRLYCTFGIWAADPLALVLPSALASKVLQDPRPICH